MWSIPRLQLLAVSVTEEAVVGYGLPQLDSSFSSFALLQTVVHVLRTSTFSSSSQGLHIGVEGAVAVGVGARSPVPQPQSSVVATGEE